MIMIDSCGAVHYLEIGHSLALAVDPVHRWGAVTPARTGQHGDAIMTYIVTGRRTRLACNYNTHIGV